MATIKKYSIAAAIAVLFAGLFSACEKNDLLADKMSSGDGIWIVEKIQYTNYDTTGAVISDSTQENVGEFIFFDSPTLNALYDYNACVYMHYGATEADITAYPCEFYTDKIRFDILDGFPLISHTYTVVDWGSQKQEWVYTQNGFNVSGPGSALSYEMRVWIKKK
jgi:hypothetical protein